MRMLLSEPRALLLDEAFSGLDASLRQQIRGLVFERARRMDLPVLMVTHDEDDAEAAGGEVIRLASVAWMDSANGRLCVGDLLIRSFEQGCLGGGRQTA